MNKQELIKKLKELLTTPSELEGYDFDDGYDLAIESAIVLAEELDDPVIPQKPKKVVIPEYVADWIEWCKKNNITLLGACTAICDNKNIRSLDASGWAMKNQETFSKAWFYGYEIEKEKLYTVEIPNPNSVGGKTVLFKQQGTGKLILQMLNSNINKPEYLHLTEAEIKEDFAWALQFKKEVKE